MALKFQYNKTALQDLRKQLSIREKALPILKNKETALRQEVRTVGEKVKEYVNEFDRLMDEQKKFELFWTEFPDLIRLKNTEIVQRNVVGVKVPEIQQFNFEVADFSWFNQNAWIPAGLDMIRKIAELQVRINVAEAQMDILQNARKKTTQKVNLYEKVQIPEYEEAILKIKRFLEDKENIFKAAQKIVKKMNTEKEAA
jgi:V/A-type H+-transporting ATPase subunit D